MKILSWNVNGLRAVMAKGFMRYFTGSGADILGLQETKLQQDQIPLELQTVEGASCSWSHAEKKGYSGVALISKVKPLSVKEGIGIPRFDSEGRILISDYGSFLLVNVYFPNGQRDEERLKYKLDFYEALFGKLEQLRKSQPRIFVCGDFNTAHQEIDLANPEENSQTSGFLRIERDWLDRIVSMGYVDTFRHFHPEEVRYSWWSYRTAARKRNVGWRIDYFFATKTAMDLVKSAFIEDKVEGSDHCPVGIELAL